MGGVELDELFGESLALANVVEKSTAPEKFHAVVEIFVVLKGEEEPNDEGMTGLEHDLLFVENVGEPGLVLDEAFLFDAFDGKELSVLISLDEKHFSVGPLAQLLDLLEVFDGVAFFLLWVGLHGSVVHFLRGLNLNFFYSTANVSHINFE